MKVILSKEEFEALNDVLKPEYKEKDGAFGKRRAGSKRLSPAATDTCAALRCHRRTWRCTAISFAGAARATVRHLRLR